MLSGFMPSSVLCNTYLMDKLVSWIKDNKLRAAAIVVLLAALAYTQLSKPRNLEDCLLQVVKDAKTERSASIGRQACRKKFPKPESIPLSFDDLIPKNS